MSLWLAGAPLVLASKSAARQALLRAAGIPFDVHPAPIDERAVEREAGAKGAGEAASLLAHAKAAAVAARMPGRTVLGADQTLALGSRRFAKPADQADAREQLRALSGRTQELYSAIALMCDDTVLFAHVDVARLTMRALSENFLDRYLDVMGNAITLSVGAYQVEGLGIHLFEQVDGDHSTILGLPLLPLLAYLRRAGSLVQ
jgi:nucleoside triphosphate pyrophosphatase